MHLLFRDNFISRFSISGFTWIRTALLGSGFHNTFLPHSILEMSKKPVCDSLPQPFLYILISSLFYNRTIFLGHSHFEKAAHKGEKELPSFEVGEKTQETARQHNGDMM